MTAMSDRHWDIHPGWDRHQTTQHLERLAQNVEHTRVARNAFLAAADDAARQARKAETQLADAEATFRKPPPDTTGGVR